MSVLVGFVLLLVVGSVAGVVVVGVVLWLAAKPSASSEAASRPFTQQEADGFEAWSERIEEERE